MGLEYKEQVRVNDTEAVEIIKKEANISNISKIQNLEIEKRNKVIKKLKNKGLSIRRI